MKIAILGTVHKKITQDTLGGTETFTYGLVEGLVKSGHEVVLFASPHSSTSARLISPDFVEDRDSATDGFWSNQLSNLAYAFSIIDQEGDFDIVHNNVFETYPALAFAKYLNRKQTVFLSTIHNAYFSNPRTAKFFDLYRNENYYFVSAFAEAQARREGYLNTGFVYNGINLDDYPANLNNPSDYFLWLGRVSDKKGVGDAITAAKQVGAKLIIAGVVDSPANQLFFDQVAKPQIDGKWIQFVGPVQGEEKIKLYQNAKALLFPVKWDEPFGLVAGEAMACGTPVIGYRRGALSELIIDQKTGFLVEEGNIAGLIDSMKRVDQIKRADCRRRVEDDFSLDKVIVSYKNIYSKLLMEKK